MFRKIWLAVSTMLLLALGYAYFRSPFIHAQGPFAQFQEQRAIPALGIGIAGAIVIAVWGYLLLRRKGRDDQTGN